MILYIHLTKLFHITKKSLKYIKNNEIRSRILDGPISFIKNWDNILLAGGSIQHYINNEMPMKWGFDYDIFIYGLNEEEAFKKAKELCKSFQIHQMNNILFANNFDSDSDSDSDFDIYITKNAITFNDIQIILKLFVNKKDILDSFDIDASCIGFDGENILLNENGKFAYETGYNKVDMKKYSSTYCHRIVKYMKKDFGTIFTNLKTINIKNKELKFENRTFDDITMVSNVITHLDIYNDQLGIESSYYDSSNWNWEHEHQYFAYIIICLKNGKDFPFKCEELQKNFTVPYEVIPYFNQRLIAIIQRCNPNIASIKKYFIKTQTIDVIKAILDKNKELLCEYIDKEIENMKELIKNYSSSISWDNYLGGLNLEEIYKYPMTYNKFYKLN